MTNQDHISAQLDYMTRTPIPRLVSALAWPPIVIMLTTSLYNMADAFFVAQLGTSAAGAVGIAFPLMAVIQALGFMVGMGSGSIISRDLGRRANRRAAIMSASAIAFAVFIGIVSGIAGLFFLEPFMRLLGSTETILPYSAKYSFGILCAAPILSCNFVLNQQLRAVGKANLALWGMATGAILNIILDPVFIFTFDLGIGGAGLATLLCQAVNLLILGRWFYQGKSLVRVSWRKISRDWRVYREIFANGIPSLLRQGLGCAAMVALNYMAGIYGDAAVAAMAIVGRITMIFSSMMIGFGQGFQPVAGYNCGAQKYGRVIEAFRFCVVYGSIFMAIGGALIFWQAPAIVKGFRADVEVMQIGTEALRAHVLAFPLLPLIFITNMLFQSLGRSLSASILSMFRQGIFFLPAILTLPHCLGLRGLEVAQPVADLCSFICASLFAMRFLRWLCVECKKQRAVENNPATR